MKIDYIPCHEKNYVKGRPGTIKYIVIHYVGALGGAKANCEYFAGAPRGASAHYFVGFDGEVWQSVLDANTAWHCGGGLQGSGGHTFHGKCTNSNSIGIEMCVRKVNKQRTGEMDKDWFFEEATIDATLELTRMLMDKYNIDADHVIRHYDVTGKICPNPFVVHEGAWTDFKARLECDMTQEQFDNMMNNYLERLAQQEPSAWSEKARTWAERFGIINGDGTGNRQYKKFCTREELAQILYNMEGL